MKRVVRGIVCGLVLSVSAVINASGAQWLTTEKYGSGSDGAYAPSTGADAPIDSACTGTINTTSLLATNAGFVPGQLILIHQTRGAGAGQWELNKIASYSAGTITTSYSLIYGYVLGAQVLVMPQYSSGNIAGGVTITGKAWNGTVGGIYAKYCNGTFTLAGTLNATGLGFRGQSGISGNGVGKQGEGSSGAGGTQSVSANGNGGGGGGYSNNGPWDQANGGGGGSNDTTNGSAGIGTGGGNNAGGGGGALGNAGGNVGLTTMVFGGAGGSGGYYNGSATSGAGGTGAGIILIISKTISITGSVTTIGGQGGGNVPYHDGAGGSGAGGSVLLKGQNITLGSNLITATGGTRVYRNGSTSGDEDGGSGGVGRIHADYGTSCTGTTNPTLDSTQNSMYIPNAPPAAFSLTDPLNLTSTNSNKPTFSWQASTDPEEEPITYTLKLISTTGVTATGGTVTNSGVYTIHTFTSSGTFGVTGSGNVEVLVVGGGGSGAKGTPGVCYGGGGGAGGVTYNASLPVTAQAYTVTVGDGGVGRPDPSQDGLNGGDSVFDMITSGGGKGGGAHAAESGGTGGSPGNFAGAGGTNPRGGGGGSSSAAVTTTGGNATTNNITGANIDYAGGGGGAGDTVSGTGGSYVGGNGGKAGVAPTSGVTYGSGGGSMRGDDAYTSGAGYKGVVVVRYISEPVYRTVPGLTTTSYTPDVGEPIADGSYYWKVIASDGVLETASTQTWQLTVDTQNPVAPVISSMYPDFATGKITKIYGTGESGTTLTFYDKNGGTISGTTVWDGGNFTFTPTTPLDPGSSVYVKSEDGASNSSQSKTRVIIFETYADIFKDDTTFHGGAPGTSMRMEKDTSYDFNIAVNDGVTPDPDKPVTVNAYVQYNTVYGSAAKPKITLSGLGILGTETGQYAVATEAAQGAWEQLTVTGTPNAKGVLTLKMETFSTVDGAKAWVDDISVAQ